MRRANPLPPAREQGDWPKQGISTREGRWLVEDARRDTVRASLDWLTESGAAFGPETRRSGWATGCSGSGSWESAELEIGDA